MPDVVLPDVVLLDVVLLDVVLPARPVAEWWVIAVASPPLGAATDSEVQTRAIPSTDSTTGYRQPASAS